MSDGQRRAILIGSSEFPQEPSLHTLRCPKNDVAGLADALTSPDFGLFTDPLSFINEPSHSILRSVNRIFSQAGPNDQILVYYSGHGKQDAAGHLHLATIDTEVVALETSSIAVGMLRRLIDNYACKQVALILDCCYSGAVGADFLNKGDLDDRLKHLFRDRGIYILTASTATQAAREKEGDDYSLFTKHLLAGIKQGEADYDDDGLVSLDDLYEYVKRRVPKEAPQYPTKWEFGIQGSSLAIARAVRVFGAERLQFFTEMIMKVEKDLDEEVFVQAYRAIKENQPKRDQEQFGLLEDLCEGRLTPGRFNGRWIRLAAEAKFHPGPKSAFESPSLAEQERAEPGRRQPSPPPTVPDLTQRILEAQGTLGEGRGVCGMIEQVSPEKTVAIVVGVEKYDLGPNWNLDGAANDALTFTRWLLDQGVRKEKLLLFLSPLDKNKVCCDESGIPYEPATHVNVMNGLNQKLNSEANLAGDLLFLFWGGHGIAESDRVRHLLFANATTDYKIAVDFNSVLEMLRDRNRRAFEYQVGIVDACANYFVPKDRRLSLASTSVSGEGASEKIKQFVMFASSIGERAEHDQDRKTGLFSSEVLQRLKQHKPMPQALWPNLNRLRDDLKAHFERLKRDDKLRFNQTPARFQWEWPDGEEGLIGAIMDSQTILRYEQAKRVYSEMIKLECTTDAFDEAYWLTIYPRLRDKHNAKGLIEQIERLVSLPPRSKNELPPLFEFAVRLDPFSAENKLIAFVKTELDRADMPLAQLRSLQEKIESEKARGVGIARGTRHILFDIGSDQIEYWHYLGNQLKRHDWLRKEGVPFANLISEHINQIESDPTTGEEMFLEFFITFDKEDNRHDFDQWEHPPSYLGCCYPVVVRWRDRTLSRKAVRQNLWTQKIRSIKERELLDRPPAIFWLPANGYTPAQLVPHLRRSEEYDCVGFSISPVGAEVAEERKRMLQAVLLSGVPFAFWPRKDPHDQDQVKFRFTERLLSSCKSASQFPNHMRSLREEATDEEQHFCTNITLLWDDPDRNPVNCEDQQLELPE